MSYTYTWPNAEKTSLKREDAEGNVAFVPADPLNRDYAEFLSSGATAAPYVAPSTAKASEVEVRKAYQEESDPLYFKWQAGEGTQQAWITKRSEVAARYA